MLLILYCFFVLKKLFLTFTTHEYDGLIVDGHNMIFFFFLPINLGSETHDLDCSVMFVVAIYIDISCPFILFSRIPSIYIKT